nr:MAG TPA: hypothetical protein [Caudoviricetes sp.]
MFQRFYSFYKIPYTTKTQEMTSKLRRHFLLPKIRKAVIQ